MHALLGFLLAAALAAVSAQAAETHDVLSPGFVTFRGSITPQTVAEFILRHRDDPVRRVVVDSPGGDVVAALSLANWMVDRGVDVEISNTCASSCANYLFAAGRRKIIDDRALVLWHGSLLQRNFRERCAPKAPRSDSENGPPGHFAGLTARAREAEAAYCASYAAAVAAQQAFFARVHVDEYVTRVGQEPTDFRAIWTLPVEAMERMGLTHVDARAGYASADDMKHFNHDPDDPERILSLGFDEAGRVIVLAR